MIDILIINLACLMYRGWPERANLLRKIRLSQFSFLPVAVIASILVLTSFLTLFSPEIINHLFLGYVAILLSSILYPQPFGLLVALLFSIQGVMVILHLEGLAFDVQGKIDATFLHIPLFGIAALLISELMEGRKKVIEENILLEAEEERLKDTEKRRSQFIHTLTHELKTPLTSTIASGEMLAEEIGEGQNLQSILIRNINDSAQEMDQRVSELLDVARMGALSFEIKPEELDIKPILSECYLAFSPQAQTREQSLKLILPPILPRVQGDRKRLVQVVQNLLRNAVKFTPRRGEIILRAEKGETDLVVEVEDNGPGIPEKEMENLFKPYYRLEAHQRTRGLGLGLYLVKRLVELHQGRVWVESKVGEGSKFCFSLPLNEDESTPD